MPLHVNTLGQGSGAGAFACGDSVDGYVEIRLDVGAPGLLDEAKHLGLAVVDA